MVCEQVMHMRLALFWEGEPEGNWRGSVYLAVLTEGVVIGLAENDMIQQVNSENQARLLHPVCQLQVVTGWLDTSGWV